MTCCSGVATLHLANSPSTRPGRRDVCGKTRGDRCHEGERMFDSEVHMAKLKFKEVQNNIDGLLHPHHHCAGQNG